MTRQKLRTAAFTGIAGIALVAGVAAVPSLAQTLSTSAAEAATATCPSGTPSPSGTAAAPANPIQSIIGGVVGGGASSSPSATSTASVSPSACPSTSPSSSSSATATPSATATATVSATPTASVSATSTATTTPSSSPVCSTTQQNLPVRFMVQQGRVGGAGLGPVANATQLVTVTVSGATPNRTVELQAYQQNHFGTATFDNAANTRTATAGSDGVATFQVRFSSNARARAHMAGCNFGSDAGFSQGSSGANSNVLYVKTVITFTVTQKAARTVTISGDSLPARPGGLVVNINCTDARCKSARNPNGILLQPRANPTTGEFGPVQYRFSTFRNGQRVTLYATTGDPSSGKGDAQNIAGRSNDRSVLLG